MDYIKAFFVGGFVRDYLLNLPPNDIDIATNALPNQIANIFEVVNNGIIEALNLGSMFYSTMTDFPQIYIINHGVINGIVLPTWSEVFKENNGQYSGNTKIVCYGGSVLNNLTEVNGFKSYDVIYEGSSILVESVDGTYERLRVNYKNRTGQRINLHL